MKSPNKFALKFAQKWYGEKHPNYNKFLFFLSAAFDEWTAGNNPIEPTKKLTNERINKICGSIKLRRQPNERS